MKNEVTKKLEKKKNIVIGKKSGNVQRGQTVKFKGNCYQYQDKKMKAKGFFFNDTMLEGVLKTAADIIKIKKFRLSFKLNKRLYCTVFFLPGVFGQTGNMVISFTPEPRHPKINRKYVNIVLGRGKHCVTVMAVDTSIKNASPFLNVNLNTKTSKTQENVSSNTTNKFCN